MIDRMVRWTLNKVKFVDKVMKVVEIGDELFISLSWSHIRATHFWNPLILLCLRKEFSMSKPWTIRIQQ